MFFLIRCLSAIAQTSPQGLYISEFMAVNARTLADEDGDYSDWLELFNSSPTTVSLDGWFLTDEIGALAKWRLPSTNLTANAALIVFASGKDRAVPGAPLHTNFKLNSAGGYLALVRPDLTIASQFNYPQQRADVSYGVSRDLDPIPLIAAGTPLRVLVPGDGALGLLWTGAIEPFDDSNWLSATNGVGFDQSTNGGPSLIAWWDFNDASNPAVAHDVAGGHHDASINGGPSYTADAGGRTGQPGDRALGFSGSGYVQVPDAAQGMFDTATAHNAITISLWIFGDASEPQNASVFYGGSNADGSGTRSLNAHLPWSDSVIYWDTAGCCDPSSTRVVVSEPDSTKWKGRWNHYAFVKNADTKEIWQNGSRILLGVNTAALTEVRSFFIGSFGMGNVAAYYGLIEDFAVWDRALAPAEIQSLAAGSTPLGVDTLNSLITTDLGAVMSNQSASAYLRVPVALEASASFNLLLLRLNYNDGFVCWLNGVEVARDNAPATLLFNSTATSRRDQISTRQAKEFDLSSYINVLHPGTNILALQGLNVSVSDPDFLVLPQLFSGQTHSNRFFTTPTPGVANGTGVLGFVGDTHFEPKRGFYSEAIDVAIWTDTPGATLVYTTNAEQPSLTNGIIADGTNALVHVGLTTVLRAAAFKDGYQPTLVDTHTYIFPASTAAQKRPATLPATWPDGYPADFAMDQRVINNPLPGYDLINALIDIPSLSLVMPAKDFWGAANGIYANPLLTLERPASVELLLPDGSPGFQADGGLALRGSSSEYDSLTPKHSFTALFRKEYGPSKVDFPVFPDTEVQEFHGLVLRGNVLDSWVNSETDFNHLVDGELRWYRTRASYVRDQWMRDSQLAQGQPAGHGRFVHLYLDGFYWGLYNLDEHLDSHFAARHFGGASTEYDVIHDSELKAGTLDAWNQLLSLAGADLSNNVNYQRLMGNYGNGTRNPGFPVLLDVTNLVDYMILHIYAGADDWPWHNWTVIRRSTPDSTGFKCLAWDQEISINSLVKQHTDAGQLYAEVDVGNCPAYIYARCRANAEFRQFFADRVQRHMFNGGALTVSNNIARYDARISEIDHAIVAESARWGDFYRPAQPYRREVEWLGTNEWMRTTFFPSNHFIALKRFRDAHLFPSIEAPLFSQFGGAVPAAFTLGITNPNPAGILYFTTDGTDPRRTGGNVMPTAQVYSTPVLISSPTLVRARVIGGGQWSALVEAMFVPPQDFSKLALTEIMYNPPPVGATNGDEFEFIELRNIGTNSLDLSGLTFTSGISFSFSNQNLLGPGQFFLIAHNGAALATRYPGLTINGVYSGKLNNGGETLTLSQPSGETIFSVTYGNKAPWPPGANGGGLSLQRINAAAYASDPNNWVAAMPTPGQAFAGADTDGDGLPDWWEVANGTNPLIPDADADPDGDGFTNLQEYLAGTDPQNKNDALRLTATITRAQDTLTLALGFQAISNRTYTILATDSLGVSVWTNFLSLPASSTNRWTTIPLTTSPGFSPRFFRLAIP
jgi:hypothetical protein